MTGIEYEQFVRAVLAKRLKIPRDRLVSTRDPGATLPGAAKLKHQIDLMFVQDSEIAEYITIIECKWRKSALVDQPEVQNLAFVKDSTRSHKAIIVTNNGFTSGAKACAESQRIALSVVTPEFEVTESYDTVDELFELMTRKVKSSKSHTMVVCRRCLPDPNEKGTDLIEGLLADPAIRKTVENLLADPGVREAAKGILRANPGLPDAARRFFGGGR